MNPTDSHFVVEPMSPARHDDFLRFFDHEKGPAFADNPEWARCYCYYYHVPRALDWKGFSGEANRVAMGSRIACGEQEGYLAYAGEEVVGWLNAHPYHKLPHACDRLGIAPPALDVPAFEAVALPCFVVAPAFRRRGVARALLDGALASLATRGIRVVDAFPFRAEGSQDGSDHYHGPESLFRATGFAVIGETDALRIMRRRLDAAAP
jgi:GNAT superfamily N-acetyltransferase